MPTHFTARRLTRATLAAYAGLTLVACSDSSSPDTTPDAEQTEEAGYVIYEEVTASLLALDPDAAMDTQTPTLLVGRAAPSRESRRSSGGPASLALASARRSVVGAAECGTLSPAIPPDTDEDGIPDEVTVTYTLPACHIVDGTTTMDMTGSMHLVDDTPAVSGMSFTLGLSALRVAISDPEFGTITVTRDGTGSVAHTPSRLDQVYDFSTRAQAFGASARVATEWDTHFAAMPGTSIVAGQPLPNGAYVPTGTTTIEQRGQRFTFTLSAPEPLIYSAACAADEWMRDYPFTSGVLRIEAVGEDAEGYAEITYSDCMEPWVTYYPGDPIL